MQALAFDHQSTKEHLSTAAVSISTNSPSIPPPIRRHANVAALTVRTLFFPGTQTSGQQAQHAGSPALLCAF
jgi:hypothetical protein